MVSAPGRNTLPWTPFLTSAVTSERASSSSARRSVETCVVASRTQAADGRVAVHRRLLRQWDGAQGGSGLQFPGRRGVGLATSVPPAGTSSGSPRRGSQRKDRGRHRATETPGDAALAPPRAPRRSREYSIERAVSPTVFGPVRVVSVVRAPGAASRGRSWPCRNRSTRRVLVSALLALTGLVLGGCGGAVHIALTAPARRRDHRVRPTAGYHEVQPAGVSRSPSTTRRA